MLLYVKQYLPQPNLVCQFEPQLMVQDYDLMLGEI